MTPENGPSVDHLVHLAGPPIRAANIVRQRCAWCGALLDEHDLDRMAYVDDGQGHPLIDEDGNPRTRWQGLVALAEGNPTVKWAVDDPEDGKILADSCMALDPAVTA